MDIALNPMDEYTVVSFGITRIRRLAKASTLSQAVVTTMMEKIIELFPKTENWNIISAFWHEITEVFSTVCDVAVFCHHRTPKIIYTWL